MITAQDQDFIERDKKLPGLRLLLDTERMCKILQNNLFLEIVEKVVPIYIRYKPGTNCLVAYHVKTNQRVIDVYARAYRNDAPEKREKTKKSDWKLRSDNSPTYKQPVLTLDNESVVIYFYPVDKKLTRLGKFDNLSRRRRLVKRLFPGISVPEKDLQFSPLRYKPERRYVVRLDMKGSPYAVLKWYTSTGYNQAKKAAKLFSTNEIIRTPKLIAANDDNNILAFEWLDSTQLTDLIKSDNPDLSYIKKTGQALSLLHHHKPKGFADLEHTHEVDEIIKSFVSISAIYPQIKKQLEKISNNISQSILKLEPLLHSVHGDFYSDQVLVLKDHTISFIDFDRAVIGDPTQDLGNFIAHVERLVIEKQISPTTADKICGALIEGYNPSDEILSRIHLYTAIGLFKLLPEPFRQRKLDWENTTHKILDAATKSLEKQSVNTGDNNCESVRLNSLQESSETLMLLNDKSMPWMHQALDSAQVGENFKVLLTTQISKKLENTLNTTFNRAESDSIEADLHVDNIKLIRHKQGRRCLLEYSITLLPKYYSETVSLKIMGKVRARGVDKKSYQLNIDLWNHEFGKFSQDGIKIPEPIGLITEWNMCLYFKVDGVPASEFLKQDGNTNLYKRFAVAIHKLHKSKVTPQKTHLMADELEILNKRMNVLADENPHWTDRINRIMPSCYELAENIKSSPLQNIHRDFYFDQIIVNQKNKQLYLIDLDLCCLGDPALDVGNFIGHLMEYSLRRYGDIDALSANCDALITQYLELNAATTQASIDIYVTLTLVRLIQISTLFPERQAFTEQLLGICEQRLGISASQSNTLAG